jgi:hypothetical protein
VDFGFRQRKPCPQESVFRRLKTLEMTNFPNTN